MTEEKTELFRETLKKLNKEDLIDQVITWWTAHGNLMNDAEKQRQELQTALAFIGRMAMDQGWERPYEE